LAPSSSSGSGPRHASDVLARAQTGRTVIQDFCPLAESIEWGLGLRYLRERGSKVFLSDAAPIPYVINNDGVLSQNVAHVFFQSLAAAERAGTLEAEIFVLELGIGVGLFARFFLDAFRDLCRQQQKDYYDRLRYVAADRSETMLADVCRHGVLAQHGGHVLVRIVDALDPQAALAGDLAFRRLAPRPFRAVFLNYLLDCLPATDLKVTEHQTQQLCVRICLGRYAHLPDYTDLSAADLARLAASDKDEDQRRLMDLYGLFVAEYDYQPVDAATLAYGDFAVPFARAHNGHILHNYGALSSLERLLALLHPEGFIQTNEYGQTELKDTDEFEHQRFSQAAFVGINFPLLKAYFQEGGRCQWFEPAEDSGRIHSRLLGHAVAEAASQEFTQRFSKAAYDKLQEPWGQARANIQYGRFEAAVSAYHQALERQPYNWLLLSEVAMFLTFTLRQPEMGVAMAREALALNPTCSPELWNTYGDALYEAGRLEEARSAYRQAMRVNPRDVRGRYNLVWVLQRWGQFAEALAMIAEALALDETGEYYERLTKKQAEVLVRLAQRQQQKMLMLANRVSKRTGAAAVPVPTDHKSDGPGSPS
jgi:tetratricopeptide (TPR) repeat protein